MSITIGNFVAGFYGQASTQICNSEPVSGLEVY